MQLLLENQATEATLCAPRRRSLCDAAELSPLFFENYTAYNRVLLEAPYLSRCSDDKTATNIRPRESALRYPYMQINRQGMVSWLIFDLDHPNSLIWELAGLPRPNLCVRNPENGHSHLYYAIEPVCTTEHGRPKPISYMKAVYAAFALRLEADTEYNSGPVAKTPGHPWWHTTEFHGGTYSLGELTEYVELNVVPWRKVPNLDEVSHSRHCMLFERLRYFAYSIVNVERARGSYTDFSRTLEAYAHSKNHFLEIGFTQNLPLSSIRSTVKSVARWVWTRYRGNGDCERGVMRLDKTLPLVERQRLAAKRTHEERQRVTGSKVRAACQRLQQLGKALLLTTIAEATRLSRQTVATYAYVIEEFSRPRAATPRAPAIVLHTVIRAVEVDASDVNHGVHQVDSASASCSVVVPGSSVPAHDHGHGEWYREVIGRTEFFGWRFLYGLCL